jgi:hypothetical protein
MTDDHCARLASIREPIERRLIYSLADNSFADVSRAWLQAGQSLVANCADYGAICDMASMVENAARQWRAEAIDPARFPNRNR